MELFKIMGTVALDTNNAEKGLKNITNEASQTQGKLSKTFSAMGKGAVAIGKTVATGLAVAGAAVTGLVVKSVQSYAEYEQLVGGVDTLFGKSSQKVQEYAKNAYKTAGMSANDYMETVTSFSASLLQSLGGDTDKAAKKADVAITDMSDNANKMGTSMEMIQNAYQGFAKQNYTMLDNLKLGYGGTKEEMQRLLEDAEKISGIEYDIDSYADVVDAIHVIQTEMGITGTTAKEASQTISGSINSMKGAWQNLLTAVSSDELPFEDYMNAFIQSVSDVTKNILPRVQIALNGVVKLVEGLAPQIIQVIPGLVSTLLPSLLSAATSIVGALANMLPDLISAITSCIPAIVQAFVTLIPMIVEAILVSLPTLVTAGVQLISSLLVGLGQMIPQIIIAIIEIVPQIIDALIQGIPQLIAGALQFFMAIVQAIPTIVQALTTALPQIITSIVNGLVSAIPQLIAGAIQLFMAIVNAIPQILPPIIQALPQIIMTIINGLLSALPQLIQGAIQLFMAIVQAIPIIIQTLIPLIPTIVTSIVSTLIDNLPILLQGAIQLFMALVTAIPTIIVELGKALPDIMTAIVKGLSKIPEEFGKIFKKAWESVKNAFKNVGGWFKEKFTESQENSVRAWANAKEKFGKVWSNVKAGFKNVGGWFKDQFKQGQENSANAWKNAKSVFSKVWNNVKAGFSNVGGWFKDQFKKGQENSKNAWSNAKSVFSKVWTNIKGAFSNVGSWFKDTFSSAKTKAVNVFSNIKSVFSNIVSKIKSAFSNVKNIISQPFEKARDAVKRVADKIKGFFNFKFSIPKIKLPKFAISPSGWKIGDLLKGSIPKLSIKWNKEGAIFSKPTIFDTQSGLQGVGEAGAEAVAPISKLQDYIKVAVADSNAETENKLNTIINVLLQYMPDLSNRQLVMDTGEVVGALTYRMDRALGDLSEKRGRGR